MKETKKVAFNQAKQANNLSAKRSYQFRGMIEKGMNPFKYKLAVS